MVARSAKQFFRFVRFDPQQPAADEKTEFDLQRRSFVLPPMHYYPGGEVKAYPVYHRWNYEDMGIGAQRSARPTLTGS